MTIPSCSDPRALGVDQPRNGKVTFMGLARRFRQQGQRTADISIVVEEPSKEKTACQ